MTPGLAWQVLLVFAAASLQSVGGGNAVLPQLQLETVVQHHWLTASQFADSFAIAQVAPGPSSLIVTLLGYRIGGLAAALLATAAMIIPSSLVVAVVGRFWIVSGAARWHVTLERGIAPIAIGLVASSGLIIARSVDTSALQWIITAAAAAALGFTRTNPLVVVLTGGAMALGTQMLG